MKKLRYIILIAIAIVLIAFAVGFNYLQAEVEDLDYATFVEHLEAGNVDVIEIKSSEYIDVKLKDHSLYRVPNPQSEDMREYFLINGADVVDKASSKDVMIQIIGLTVIVIAGYLFLRKGIGKDKLEIIDANNQEARSSSTYNFDSVAGNEEAKELVKDIIEFIKKPDKYANLGAKMPRGIMLYGPPGTGKTLMAKAVAGEAGVPFYPVSGSDFIQMYVGVGASRIRQLFKKAKKSKKAVIFIDEIDAIGKKRGNGLTQANDERDQTLNALLTEMSGFNDSDGIVVIGATNRLDTLDDALLRPGRFDRLIEIGLPDINARKKILSLHSKNKPIALSVDIDKLARDTVYFSGAMLENLTNEAAILAANEDRTEITQREFEEAFYNVLAGSAKKDRSFISLKDMEITAYHESGHALVTKLLLPENIISKVTIIPSTKGFGGFSMNIPKDRMYRTKEYILSNIKVMLAGRVAEELIFGADYITTGASNDIEKASKLIKDYIIKYGMDDQFGIFNLDAVDINLDSIVLERCREKMNALYEDTRELISEKIQLLHCLADALLSKETLEEEAINDLLSGKSIA